MTTSNEDYFPAYMPDLPICDLSFHDEWTPLNRFYFSQCINNSHDERTFCSERKKKWKRTKCPYKNEKMKRKYIVYKYASEVSASDEFSSNDEYEEKKKRKNLSDEYECSSGSESYVSDEYECSSGSESYVSEEYECSSGSESYISDKSDSTDEKENSQLSEYEKMVQKNREEKMAFLKSIKTLEDIENFSEILKAKIRRTGRKSERDVLQNCGNTSHFTKNDI